MVLLNIMWLFFRPSWSLQGFLQHDSYYDKSCIKKGFLRVVNQYVIGPSSCHHFLISHLHQRNRGHTLSFLWVRGVYSTLAGLGLLTLCTHYARFGCHPWTNHVANFSFLPSQAMIAWIFWLSYRFDDPVVVSDHAINEHICADFTNLFLVSWN